jgi:hypothetical protein
MSAPLAGVLAEQTTCPVGQNALAARPALHPKLARNRALNPDAWQTLHASGNAAILTVLARGELTEEQKALLLADTRVGVLSALVGAHQFTDEQYDKFTTWQTSQAVVDALVKNPRTPLPQWLSLHQRATYGCALDGSVARDDVPHQVDLDLCIRSAGRNFTRGIGTAHWLDVMLDRHPRLAADLLAILMSSSVPRSWGRNNGYALKEHLAMSQHLPADAWTSYQTFHTRLGAKPLTASGNLGVIAVYGNPNTGADGVAWCREYLTRKAGTAQGLGSGTATQKFAIVHEARETLAATQAQVTPVTGPWDAGLPADQQQTLAALQTTGLVHSRANTHPRSVAAKAAADTALHTLEPISGTGTPAPDAALGRSVHAAPSTWTPQLTTHVEEQLNGDPHRWETMIALMPDWSGSVRELLDASCVL